MLRSLFSVTAGDLLLTGSAVAADVKMVANESLAIRSYTSQSATASAGPSIGSRVGLISLPPGTSAVWTWPMSAA